MTWRAAAALALLGAAALGGCGSALEPFATVPSPAAPGTAAGQSLGLCYNRLTTSLAEVRTQAQKECGAGKTAEPVDTDWYLQYCPVLLPAHATFVCRQKK